MKPDELIKKLDDARIVQAIAEAEGKTSGEIRVCISRRRREDPLLAAQARFLKLGMEQTRHRNAVLIYFIPLTHQFALWGDTGVHEKCGMDFWKDVVAQMMPLLKEGRFTEAIELAVRNVGDVLARHFPPESGNRDELPNRVDKD